VAGYASRFNLEAQRNSAGRSCGLAGFRFFQVWLSSPLAHGMTYELPEFGAREGGSIRISLTYDAPTRTGKTTAHTDTYQGRFLKLVPYEQVIEVDESRLKIPHCAAR